MTAAEEGGGGNDPTPGAVTMTFATISSTGFSFGWVEPGDTDLASIRIEYKGVSDTDFTTLAVLDPVDPLLFPDRSNNWNGSVALDVDARYDIAITTIDAGEQRNSCFVQADERR